VRQTTFDFFAKTWQSTKFLSHSIEISFPLLLTRFVAL